MFVEDTVNDETTYKLGLYGMGGLGKTTLSRALCMFFHKHFNGRVFHVELGSRPPLDLQKLVLTKLLRINKDVVDRVHTTDEGRQLLKDHMSQQLVFLVIDNITNDHESKSQASAFLEVGFHPGSMIMITSRSLDVVEDLFPSHLNATYCKPMAMLNKEEARLIFLQRAAPQQKMETLMIQEQEILDECVSQCHFLLDNYERQYHPLALQALADYYREKVKVDMLKWKGHLGDLDKLRLSNASSNIFGVLELQFTTLELKKKRIFLDLCLYIKESVFSWYSTKHLRWLADIHEDTSIVVESQLQSLKRSSIINITRNDDGHQFITIHDLYREFAKWYLLDGEGSRCPELGCVYHTVSAESLPYVLKRTSPTLSQLLQRIRLENFTHGKFPSKKVQEWCNVVVLQIHNCQNLVVLDLHGLSCLCHLELVNLLALESFHFAESQANNNNRSYGTLESLQHVVLASLTSLSRLPNFSLCTLLKTFRMLKCEQFLSEPPSFVGCSQLEALKLDWNWQRWMEDFKVDTLTSLTSLKVHCRGILRTSRGGLVHPLDLENLHRRQQVVNPEHVNIRRRRRFLFSITVIGLGSCSRLQKLRFEPLPFTSLVGLEKLTELQVLHLSRCQFLFMAPNISTLAKLKQLDVIGWLWPRFLGVEKLHQLRRLSFEDCPNLTLLPDLDHLQELKYVVLFNCGKFKVKPRLPPGCKLICF